jgi:S-ribosylhomocysteine lyase LuxS involved in autoinducer biosynthesis
MSHVLLEQHGYGDRTPMGVRTGGYLVFRGRGSRKEECSFLKKRTKKLFFV